MAITSVQAKVTRTAAANGSSVDVSGISGYWTLHLKVLKAVPAGGKIRFSFPDSVNAFTAQLPGPAFSVQGKVEADAPKVFSVTKNDFPSLRFGTASAVIRCQLDEITGASPSVDYEAWLES